MKTLLHSLVKIAGIYNLDIRDINRQFKLNVVVYKVEKEILLAILCPNYRKIQTLNDSDTKKELPVHIIIGAGDCTKIKAPGPQQKQDCQASQLQS